MSLDRPTRLTRAAPRGTQHAWRSSRPRSATVERMTIQRMDHVGIVVDDLAAATAFFVEL
jgi:hypothetical protein